MCTELSVPTSLALAHALPPYIVSYFDNRLPTDVKHFIFAFIPQRPRLLVISLVSKRWRKLVLSSVTSFTHPDLTLLSFDPTTAWVLNFATAARPITALNIFLPPKVSLELQMAHERLSALTRLRIDVSESTPSIDALQHWRFPCLLSLTLYSFVPSPQALLQLVNAHASQLTELAVFQPTPIVPELMFIDWPVLRTLSLDCPIRNASDVMSLILSLTTLNRLGTCRGFMEQNCATESALRRMMFKRGVQHDLWKPVFLRKSSHSQPVHFPNLTDLTIPHTPHVIHLPSSLQSLTLIQDEEVMQIMHLRQLRSLKYEAHTTAPHLTTLLLQNSATLASLTLLLHHCTVTPYICGTIGALDLPSLTYLDISQCVNGNDVRTASAMVALIRRHSMQLQTLKCHTLHLGSNVHSFPQLHTLAVYVGSPNKLPTWDCLPSLTSLSIPSGSIAACDATFYTSIPWRVKLALGRGTDKLRNVLASSSINLTSLGVTFGDLACEQLTRLVGLRHMLVHITKKHDFKLLRSLTQLTSLYLSLHYVYNCKSLPAEIMPPHLTSLTCSAPSFPVIGLAIAALKGCTSLQTLYLRIGSHGPSETDMVLFDQLLCMVNACRVCLILPQAFFNLECTTRLMDLPWVHVERDSRPTQDC